MAEVLRRLASGAVRAPVVVRAATSTRRARGRGLALLWHRIAPECGQAGDVVPTVAVDLFQRQLEAVSDVGDIVPLAELEQHPTSRRPRFAVTFDDDHRGHARHALPVLAAAGVSATFFLSGRWTVPLGRYWWEHLEDRLRREPPDTVARSLGVAASSATELARRLETDPDARARLRGAGNEPPPMPREDAVTLVDAGMEIGFHTLHHPVLPTLPGNEQARHVTLGRRELSRDLGVPLDRFAYPHGRVDATVASHVAAAGYRSAWSTDHRPVDPASDPARRGRWEPGPRHPDDLVRGLLRRLNLPS